MSSKKKLKNTVEKELSKALEPCYADPPAAGAVLLVVTDAGIEHYVLNLDPMEVTHLLLTTGMYLSKRVTPHQAPEILQ